MPFSTTYRTGSCSICQGGNETFQGLLTSPPEIGEDHAGLFSVDVYLTLVQEGKFTMLSGPQTLSGLRELNDPLTADDGITL